MDTRAAFFTLRLWCSSAACLWAQAPLAKANIVSNAKSSSPETAVSFELIWLQVWRLRIVHWKLTYIASLKDILIIFFLTLTILSLILPGIICLYFEAVFPVFKVQMIFLFSLIYQLIRSQYPVRLTQREVFRTGWEHLK